MTEAEEQIAREVYDYLNSCSFGDLMRVYHFIFGRTEIYVKAADEKIDQVLRPKNENKHE